MDQACRWVIKYFLVYLAMLRSNLDHAVVTATMAQQWRRRLSAGGEHFEHYF